MINLYIDSNIWLSIYHFTNDDLEQFSKLQSFVGKGIRLFIPEQTRNEVQRNRDAKIRDALTKFEKFEFTFPAFCKSYDEYSEFNREYRNLKQVHKEWCNKIHKDISNQSLPADKVIADFFSICSILPCSSEMVRKAELRYKAGNPPGKDNKLGDAINWECLIETVPDYEDLHFISSDKDYASVVDDQTFNLFIKEECHQKKSSNIVFYKTLVSFLGANVKEISLQTEQMKNELINGLRYSRNFATTHTLIAELNEYDDWNNQQVDDICLAAIENSQVRWLLGDDDVYEFYNKLLSDITYDTENITEVRELLNTCDR